MGCTSSVVSNLETTEERLPPEDQRAVGSPHAELETTENEASKTGTEMPVDQGSKTEILSNTTENQGSKTKLAMAESQGTETEAKEERIEDKGCETSTEARVEAEMTEDHDSSNNETGAEMTEYQGCETEAEAEAEAEPKKAEMTESHGSNTEAEEEMTDSQGSKAETEAEAEMIGRNNEAEAKTEVTEDKAEAEMTEDQGSNTEAEEEMTESHGSNREAEAEMTEGQDINTEVDSSKDQSPDGCSSTGWRKRPKDLHRSLSSLDHEECIFFLEHLHITNVRATLSAGVTGKEISALKSAADLERLGVILANVGVAPLLKKIIKKYTESGIKQSVLDERRAIYVKGRALQRGVSPVLIAFEDKDLSMFAILTQECEDIDAALTNDGKTALHLAAELGAENSDWFEECLVIFLDRKANLDIEDASGATAMHLAAKGGHKGPVELLFSANASATKKDSTGLSVITCAALAGNQEIVHLLCDKAYDRIPFHSLSDNECVDLLFALGCIMSADATEYRMRWVDVLEAIDEEIDTEKVIALKGLGMWESNVEMREIATALRQMRANGVSEGMFVLANEKRASGTNMVRIIRHWFAEAKEKNISPLNLAAAAGDVEGVKALLLSKNDMLMNETEDVKLFMSCSATERINQIQGQSTALHSAVNHGHAQIVSFLVAHRANIEAKDEGQCTPLHYAARNGHTEILSFLIAQRANIQAVDKIQLTPLHHAARNGHTEIVSLLITQRANIEAKNGFKRTPLHNAAGEGHTAIVSLLIANKAHIGAMDQGQSTPLHYAAENGHTDIVSLLITQRANIESKDENQHTPLFAAAGGDHTEVVSLLIAHKADIEALNKIQWAPLHYAALNGHTEIVSLLITHNASIETINKYRTTPLHDAALNGHAETVSLLIERKANVNGKNDFQSTSLHYAADNGRKEVVSLLIANKADIEAADQIQSTSLHYAAYNGHAEIVSLLIAKRANFEAKNGYGKTPLDLANKESIKVLLKDAKESIVNSFYRRKREMA